MVRQGEGSSSSNVSNLLNFHFSTSPAAREDSHFGGRRRGERNNHPSQGSQPYRRSKEDRSSARRRASQQNFYLHSSADHAFVISRRPPFTGQQVSFRGVDSPVSWSSVRICKYLCTMDQDHKCPICLDDFVAARMSKCGHSFCFPCILHHIQSYVESNQHSSQGPKCPCCAIPIHTEDLRPVQNVTVAQPFLHQAMKFVKLHRCKECPAPFLPRPQHVRRSSPLAAPCQSDADAPFCKFTYVDPVVYVNHLTYNLQELRQEQMSGGADAMFRDIAVERVQREIQAAVAETNEEFELIERYRSPSSGFYQQHPQHLIASNHGACNILDRRTKQAPYPKDSIDTSSKFQLSPNAEEVPDLVARSPQSTSTRIRFRSESIESVPTFQYDCRPENDGRLSRESSISSEDSAISDSGHINTGNTTIESSLFLDAEDVDFYQADDGSLCFLSGFNMKCLRSDFSPTVPDERQLDLVSGEHKGMPLPDCIEGKVLEIEHVCLTPETRDRFRFLSHLPLYTDVRFIEIDLGHILSVETTKTFKKEIQKRKRNRMNRLNSERRTDDMLRREEEARISERKSRWQRIDPSDDFFHAATDSVDFAGEEFGPPLPSTRMSIQQPQSPIQGAGRSFSQICREGGAITVMSRADDFPILSQPDDFPALGPGGASPGLSTFIGGRGGGTSTPKPARVPGHTVVPEGGVKKKTKPKKILLFSTGGHRGSSY